MSWDSGFLWLAVGDIITYVPIKILICKEGLQNKYFTTSLYGSKVLIILALAVAAQSAAVVYHPAWWPAASAYQAKDALGNYVFGHHDSHPGGPSFHSESGDISGKKVGSYGVKDPDGKVRIVDYVADHEGFKANIKTSEKLAEDHKDPAGVTTSEVKPVAPVVYAHPFPYFGHPYLVAY
ncbi:cuticle protein 14 isoform b [Trichonephila inaurata madagascariensis]|uniref:Cuticle protein 14 isoform b n=1 Tax=Trichonephila inaurata madagascariensis TaxID=2747483 RepID=A0A8X6X9S9_9ARAC|nr:cuticle protein 14 isoform b [Trichonephila inaurata madagascariensis]